MTRRDWIEFGTHLALIAVLVGGSGAYVLGWLL